MKRIAILALCFVTVVALYIVGTKCLTSQPGPSLSPNEKSEMVKATERELDRLNVPVGKREALVTLDGDVVTVEFPPPQGMRAGSFVIKLDKKTRKVLDSKIWR